MGKVTTNDDKPYGLAGAAAFLVCDRRTVLKHADEGRLPCIRDSSGKRLFAFKDLERFKRNNHIGNQQRLPANDARNTRFPTAKKKKVAS